MKKICSTIKWKTRSLRIRKKHLRRKLAKEKLAKRKEKSINANALPSRKLSRKKIIKGLGHPIEAPTNFSIIDNPEEMLLFFNEMYDMVRGDLKPMFLNMAGIKNLTVDAILYMLSAFNNYKKKYGYESIGGNYPVYAPCRELLIESGFLQYVHPRQPLTRTRQNIMS